MEKSRGKKNHSLFTLTAVEFCHKSSGQHATKLPARHNFHMVQSIKHPTGARRWSRRGWGMKLEKFCPTLNDDKMMGKLLNFPISWVYFWHNSPFFSSPNPPRSLQSNLTAELNQEYPSSQFLFVFSFYPGTTPPVGDFYLHLDINCRHLQRIAFSSGKFHIAIDYRQLEMCLRNRQTIKLLN